MRIAVLGAGGVFGQNFAQFAKDAGHEVYGIGRSARKAAPYSLDTDFDYVQADVLKDLQFITAHIKKHDYEVVVNFAAQAGLVPQSWQYPVEFWRTNCMLPVRLAKWLPRNCRYIHIGSSEVYGSTNFPASEDSPIRPSSPYAASKAAADMHLMTLNDERITVVRPSNCYAPGQALYRLIPRAVLASIGGPRMEIAGNPQKSYMHAQDLSEAILMLAESRTPGLFNCGPESPVSIRKLVQMVAQAHGKELEEIADEKEGRAHEDACFFIGSEKLRRLGWRPKVSLAEGMEQMRAWGERYREQILTLPTGYEFRP